MVRLVRRAEPPAIARVFGTVAGEICNKRSPMHEKPLPIRPLSLRKIAQGKPPVINGGRDARTGMHAVDNARIRMTLGGDADCRCADLQEEQ